MIYEISRTKVAAFLPIETNLIEINFTTLTKLTLLNQI